MRRFQCAFSDTVSTISSISVDALVSRFVLSLDISDAQRRESEFMAELISIRDRVLCLPCVYFVRVTLRHLLNMFACLKTLASFLFVSFFMVPS